METLYFGKWIKSEPAERFAQQLEDLAREKELALAWKELDETRTKYPEYFSAAAGESPAAGKMSEEIDRVLPEAIRVFSQHSDIPLFQFLVALPKRLGLNEQLFARLLPATMLARAKSTSDITALINFYKTEHELLPQRQADRLLQAKRDDKRRIEAVYAEAGLSSQAVFDLLGTPYGPERGPVMRAIYDAVANPDAPLGHSPMGEAHDFGPHTPEIISRARRVKERLASVGRQPN